MPLTCVVLDGETYPIAVAREIVAQRDGSVRYTPELLDAMLATRQERDYISTTSLTAKCTRQQSIMRQYEYAEDVDAMWASFRGTMFHGQLEKNVVKPAVEEPRFFVTIDGIELSGSPDLIDPVSGVLYDYKFCKEVPRWNKPWPDHVEQGQINRWLCDHAEKVVWRNRTYTSQATITRLFRPVDWQAITVVYMDDKGVKPLTCMKSIQVPKVSGEGTKAASVPDIWTDEQVEDLILGRLPRVYDALTNLNIPPAAEGWEHQSHVLCGYCPVRRECAALEREGK